MMTSKTAASKTVASKTAGSKTAASKTAASKTVASKTMTSKTMTAETSHKILKKTTFKQHYIRSLGILGAVALLATTAACSSSKGAASKAPGGPLAGEGIGPGGVPTGGPTGAPQPCHGDATTANTWQGSLPAAGSAMPSGSTMAKIQQRGFLVAGIDMSTWLFGYDPNHTNVPQGFDVDIAKEIAKAIFGDANPNHIKFQVVTLADPTTGEIAQLNATNVDVVVRTTTITCARLANANFSNPYFTARQKLLMPIGADGKAQKLGLADMTGKQVCATKNSTALMTIAKVAGAAAAYPAANALDCLAYLQQGKVDGVFTDDSILLGMEAQDPKVKITTAQTSATDDQPYGIVTAKANTDMAQFVNGVLANILGSGQWSKLVFANGLQTSQSDTPKIPADYPLG
jgi:polar amino acid transport system substrate-binding protein